MGRSKFQKETDGITRSLAQNRREIDKQAKKQSILLNKRPTNNVLLPVGELRKMTPTKRILYEMRHKCKIVGCKAEK